MRESWRLGATLALLWVVSSCAPVNAPLKQSDYRKGYRFGNLSSAGNSDDLFVVLTLSGGGTRAAAFSYGVLKELRETRIHWQDADRRLLDEVDVIASVSGGSFTAAYYGLYRERIFDDFERRFLKRDIEGSLFLQFFWPWNWFLLASPYYSRIDLAAGYYGRNVFNGEMFESLTAGGKRPFIILNATDLSLGERFEFTQGQFDLLQSDLSRFEVARAVAASSAFPGLLTPMRLANYPKTSFLEPSWVENAIGSDIELSPRRFTRARHVRSYFDVQERPFVHLVDGGVSDNIGLRGPLNTLMFPDTLISGAEEEVTDSRELSILRMIADEKIHKLVFIVVDAKTAADPSLDRSECTPGLIDVVFSVACAPLENYSFETVQLLREYLESREVALRDQPKPLKTYAIHVRFDAIPDEKTRQRLDALGTNYDLPGEAVDELIQAGGVLLRSSEAFRKLLTDLEN